jgi:uncharacterized SAM-binding protein YcdF (DUF218 family)
VALLLLLLRPLRLLLLLVAVWLVACWFLLLHPKSDSPRHADVVMVLSGDAKYRLPTGLRLMRAHVAPTLVISDGLRAGGEATRLCTHPPRAYHVTCFHPSPYSTRGEAEWLARTAKSKGWRSVAIVSSPTHLTRLRILFKRCYHGKLYAVRSAQTVLSKAISLFYETAKLVVETTAIRSC